jgi:DNA primase
MPPLARKAIAILLHYPRAAQFADNRDKLAELKKGWPGLLVNILDLLHHHPELKPGALLEHWREREPLKAEALARTAQRDLLLGCPELIFEFIGAVKGLEQEVHDLHLESLGARQLNELTEDDKVFVRTFNDERQRLHSVRTVSPSVPGELDPSQVCDPPQDNAF